MRTVNIKLERFIARITGDTDRMPRGLAMPIENDIVFFRDKSGRSQAQDRQLISRLAMKRKVLVVGDAFSGTPSNVTFISPPEEGTELSYEMDPLMSEHVRMLHIRQPILWFTSPAYSDLIDTVEHSMVIYDCTRTAANGSGELSQIQEDYLLSFADIVLAWDKDTYIAKRAARMHVFRLEVPKEGKDWDAAVRSMDNIISSAKSRSAFWEDPKSARSLFALG